MYNEPRNESSKSLVNAVNGTQSRTTEPSPTMQQAISDSNELVKIAMPLITLITQIRHTVSHPNVESLRNQVVEEIKNFERKLSAINYSARIIMAARYCLCTAIDETVLSQDWGTRSVWVQGSLLSIFQKETWGGERFYVIMEDALRDTQNNIDFIELIYFLLSLGFEGKLFGDENRGVREEIRNKVFYCVRHARMKPERNLSPNWKNTAMPAVDQHRRKTLKKVALSSLVLVVILSIFYNVRVYEVSKSTVSQFNDLATGSPVITFSHVINRSIVEHNNSTQGN